MREWAATARARAASTSSAMAAGSWAIGLLRASTSPLRLRSAYNYGGGRCRAIGLALLLAACTPAAPSPSAQPSAIIRSVTGTLELHGRAAATVPGRCYGTGGYDDIDTGTQVRVTNQDGTLIGTGTLEEGEINGESTICTFRFAVDGLPDADFYSIEVSHRGELTYSPAELEAQAWAVTLTLGN